MQKDNEVRYVSRIVEPAAGWGVAEVNVGGFAVGVFFLLMEVVFPYVAELMPYSDVAV